MSKQKDEEIEKEKLADALVEIIDSVSEGEENNKGISSAATSEVNTLLSTLPRTSGFYFKVYKTKPLPQGIDRPQFKIELMDIGTIDDLEVYIRNLAMENDWGPGEYMISTFRQDGGKKIAGLARKPVKIAIDYSKALPLSSDTLDSVRNVKGLMEAVKDFLPPSAQTNPQETTKMLIDMFKTGLESARTDGNFPIIEIIKLIKESTEKKNSLDELAGLVRSLRDIGIVKDTTQDSSPIDEILKYREFFEKLGFSGESIPGGRVSPFMELLKVIGPFLPDLISRITEPLNKFLDLKTMQIQASLSPATNKFIPAKLPEKPLSSMTTKKTEATKEEKEQEGMLPVSKELIDKGEAGYPEFYEQIYTFPQMRPFLEAFRQGLITDSQIIEGLPKEVPPEMIEYLKNFLGWLRTNISDMGAEVLGICAKCGTSYDYASKDAYEEDDKLCEEITEGERCSGQIELKIEQQIIK